jgi:nucleotide-binding universal stress UspA family protein
MKINKILIGIDDSTYAHHAAEYGFDMARAYDAAVGLVHIIEPVVLPPEPIDTMTGISMGYNVIQDIELVNIQNTQSKNLIERIIKELGKDIQVTTFTQYGITADGIIECSKEFNADLIVVGTHKRSGLDRLLSGSVAEHVVRHSDVPVMVVPAKE